MTGTALEFGAETAEDASVEHVLWFLHEAIARRDVPGIGWLLHSAGGLLGPHFRFEELSLADQPEKFTGRFVASCPGRQAGSPICGPRD